MRLINRTLPSAKVHGLTSGSSLQSVNTVPAA
jgi:hypothetical protein